MKRYLLFENTLDFYPCGGWKDLVGDFDSIEEALNAPQAEESFTWSAWHIADTETMKIVLAGDFREPDSDVITARAKGRRYSD